MKKHDLAVQLDYFIQELKFQELSENTLLKYNSDCKMFIASISHEKDITKNDTLAFKRSLTYKDYKASSINSYITSVNKFLNWLKLSSLTVEKLRIQAEYSLDEVIDDNDYQRLLKFAEQDEDFQLMMIMKTIKTTGIRISELKFFTVDSIQSFYIPISNKGKIRELILTKELRNELHMYCKEQKIRSGAIFTYSNPTIWRHMKRIAGQARVKKEKVHPHSFRHYFAKSYIAAYGNQSELADILGHSSIETTRIYTRSTNEEKRKRMELL